ncbi:MAG TPA: (2Fe-2S)-binding protein [Abditibacteriaceae bacterium]|jgi:NAD(P)H-nitrite reductase large subunit
MVTHCLCFDVSFEELKAAIEQTGARNCDELRTHIQFGEKCQLCVPYVEKIFLTGKTAFEPERRE